MNPFIKGKHIVLRALKKEDVKIWFNWFNTPEITGCMNKGIFPNTFESQEEFYRNIQKSKTDIQLAITAHDHDDISGIIGLHKIDWVHRHADVSIVIGNPSHFGQGKASEAVELIVRHAFHKLNLNKLTSGMWEPNAGCRRCFEKNGFIQEGIIRKQFFYQGEFVDEFRFGLLRHEWEQTQKSKLNQGNRK